MFSRFLGFLTFDTCTHRYEDHAEVGAAYYQPMNARSKINDIFKK